MSRKYEPKRRPAQTVGTSLFPFLAVLLCTMGALIMLLVVIARNVREYHEIAAVPVVKEVLEDPQESLSEEPENILERLTAQDVSDILEQIQMGTEEVEWFAENLAEVKKENLKEIGEKKTRLALLEKETQRVHDEIERLAKLAEKLEGDEKSENVDLETLKKRLEQRKKEREQVELELAELQKEVEQDKKSYAIIPYRGKSGTFRRPIYIECRGDKVIIQPEGVELHPDDFLLHDRPDNPFDAVLRVIRQYYIETNQIVRGSEPYPLLIVRPSGVDTYKTTRDAIGSWIKEFGYELVDEDWKIEYPQPSEELRERIEKQLQTSRTRMMGYLAAMNAAGAASAQQHREQYRLDHRGQLQRADGFSSSPAPRFGGGSAGGGGQPSGGGSARRSTAPGRGTPMPGQNGGTGSSPDVSLSPFPQTASAQNAASNGVGDIEMPESLRAELSQSRSNSPPGTGQHSSPTPPAPAQAQGPYAQTMPPGYATSGNQQAASGQANDSTQTAAEKQDVIGILEPMAGAKPSNQMPNILAQPGGEQRQQAAAQTAANAPSQGPIGSVVTGADQPSGATGMGGPMAENMAEEQNGQPGPQTPMISKTSERKENWALRGMQPFSAAISRPVKIQCDANKFVLMPQKGLAIPKVIPITDSVLASTDKLVHEVWEYMDTWGIAGEKTFWRPVLEVTVTPGGEQRFKELKYLLRNSGLVVEEVRK